MENIDMISMLAYGYSPSSFTASKICERITFKEDFMPMKIIIEKKKKKEMMS